jgi:hypothetical protein
MSAFKEYQVKLDGTGAGTLRINLDIHGVLWDVSQINISTNPTNTTCIATLSYNNLYISNTIAGSNDSAAGPPPIHMISGDEIEVVWASGPANALATATILYDEYQLQ